VKCNPKKWDKSGRVKNRNPTRKEIENCRHFLENELRILNPRANRISMALLLLKTSIFLVAYYGERLGE